MLITHPSQIVMLSSVMMKCYFCAYIHSLISMIARSTTDRYDCIYPWWTTGASRTSSLGSSIGTWQVALGTLSCRNSLSSIFDTIPSLTKGQVVAVVTLWKTHVKH